MGSESLQKKLGRVNRPRVQIQYDVETNGAIEKIELPFVVAVMSDLSGQPKDPLPPLKERDLVQIDHENFDKVLAGMAPRLTFRVQNKLTDENTQMNVELNFKKFEDFEPAQVAGQIPALKDLMDMRAKLKQLQVNLAGNDKLEAMLADILANPEKAKALSDETTEKEGDTNG